MNTSQPVHPIPRPASGDDPRLRFGLDLDVAAVLARHGYPAITTSTDLPHRQQALFATIYQPRENL
jgi:hypothetical protein